MSPKCIEAIQETLRRRMATISANVHMSYCEQYGFAEHHGMVSESLTWPWVVQREHRFVWSGPRIISGKRHWDCTQMSVMGSFRWAYIADMAIHPSRLPRGGQDVEIRVWAERKEMGKKGTGKFRSLGRDTVELIQVAADLSHDCCTTFIQPWHQQQRLHHDYF